MPLNDLDCCLISIHEKKIEQYKKEKKITTTVDKLIHINKTKKVQESSSKHPRHLIVLPFSDMKVNLYNYSIKNKNQEIRMLKKKDQRERPKTAYKIMQ